MAERVTSIALVDLNYLWKKNWLGMPRDASPGDAAQATLDQLAGVRESVSRVVVCVDAPPYRRKEVYPEYKAQREAPSSEENAQKRWLMDRIEKDGYQIARVKGYEADDLIATLCLAYAVACGDIRIIASDKDTAQCVNGQVRMFVPSVGNRPAEVRGPEEIRKKYGVAPESMGLWLALVGDSGDNIPGVPGIGEKKAAALIEQCKDLNGIAEALATLDEGEKPSAMWRSLAEHWESLRKWVSLTALETDVPIDALALLGRKEAQKLVEDDEVQEPTDAEFDMFSQPKAEEKPMTQPEVERVVADAQAKAPSEPPKPQHSSALAVVREEYGTVDLELQPQDLKAARNISKWIYNGRLYPQFPTPEGIFTIIMRGKELGIGVTTSLAGFHLVEGRPTASADLIRSLAERDPACEYFRLVDSTQDSATWETKHRAHPEPTRYTYTLREAEVAGLTRATRSGKPSPWQNRPRDMVTKTAGAKLARICYPGATLGLYSPEELSEGIGE